MGTWLLQHIQEPTIQPETSFKIRIQKELKKIPKSYFEKIQQRSLRGTPDILGVVNGYAVCLELKVDAPLEAMQEYKLGKWEKAGAQVYIMTPENEIEVLFSLHSLSRL